MRKLNWLVALVLPFVASTSNAYWSVGEYGGGVSPTGVEWTRSTSQENYFELLEAGFSALVSGSTFDEFVVNEWWNLDAPEDQWATAEDWFEGASIAAQSGLANYFAGSELAVEFGDQAFYCGGIFSSETCDLSFSNATTIVGVPTSYVLDGLGGSVLFSYNEFYGTDGVNFGWTSGLNFGWGGVPSLEEQFVACEGCVSTLMTRSIAVVPEPTTLGLFAAGLAGLGFSARRRKQTH